MSLCIAYSLNKDAFTKIPVYFILLPRTVTTKDPTGYMPEDQWTDQVIRDSEVAENEHGAESSDGSLKFPKLLFVKATNEAFIDPRGIVARHCWRYPTSESAIRSMGG